MTVKQVIGVTIILIIVICTALAVGGIWGLVSGDTAWQVFYTLIALAAGLGTAGRLVDIYFRDKSSDKGFSDE